MRPFETKLQEYNIFAYYAQYTFKKFEQEIWKNEPFLNCLFWKNILKMLFIYGCASFSLVAESGGYSLDGERASRHSSFSHCGAQTQAWASAVAARWLSRTCSHQTLGHRLSNYGLRALLLRGMWDLPGPGIKPVFPTLTGGFFTIEPLEKSKLFILYWNIVN